MSEIARNAARTRHERVALAGILIALCLCGAFLRLWLAGTTILSGDEVHQLVIALERPVSWVLTHRTLADTSIPMTLYNKLLIANGVFSEWSMRLPVVAAAIGWLVLIAWLAGRYLRGAEAVTITALMALSPYLVYLSREARPYPVVTLLFWLATAIVLRWLRGGPGASLATAGVLAALAAWFHPIVLPSVLLLGLLPAAVLAWRRAPARDWRPWLQATAAFGVTAAFLIGPTLGSLMDFIHAGSRTVNAGFELSMANPTVTTLRDALLLVHGLPVIVPLAVWVVMGAAGAVMLGRRYPVETGFLTAALLAQTGAIFIARSYGSEYPPIMIRYVVHLVPFILLLPIVAAAGALRALARGLAPGMVAVAVSSAAALAYGAWNVQARHYVLDPASTYSVYPFFLFAPRNLQDSAIGRLPFTPVYTLLREKLPEGALIEAPTSPLFPLYGLYQHLHHRHVIEAALGPGPWQELVRRETGLHLARVMAIDHDHPPPAGSARYLLVHKRTLDEFEQVMTAAREVPLMQTQFRRRERGPTSRRGLDRIWKSYFGVNGLVLDAPWTAGLPVVYEDEWVTLYDLAGNAATH